jgi:DNA repair protein RadD
MEYYQIRAIKSQNLILNSTKADYTDKSVKEEYKRAGFENKVLGIIERLIRAGRENILVFTRFVEEAQFIVDNLLGLGEIVTAQTPKKERERIISEFKSGEIRVVANVGILTTGFDYPELSTVVLARPTMSLTLYYQMIGRAIRPHENKPCSWVIDMCENYDRFGKVEELQLIQDKPGIWYIRNKSKQLTNVFYN